MVSRSPDTGFAVLRRLGTNPYHCPSILECREHGSRRVGEAYTAAHGAPELLSSVGSLTGYIKEAEVLPQRATRSSKALRGRRVGGG